MNIFTLDDTIELNRHLKELLDEDFNAQRLNMNDEELEDWHYAMDHNLSVTKHLKHLQHLLECYPDLRNILPDGK